jgi:hypothetical protein
MNMREDGTTVPGYYFDMRNNSRRFCDKKSIAADLKLHDYYLTQAGVFHDLHAFMNIIDSATYRVQIRSSGVDVFCFGLESIDAKCEGAYTSVDSLPQWLQERLAVLMVASSTPPTVEIPKIGRRISERVFWVYAPEHNSEVPASASA